VRAAALKLRQQGVSESQVRALSGGNAAESLLLPGKSVWVYAQVHDRDSTLVAPGQQLVVTTPAVPGRSFAARVASIDPIADPMTRTTRVRALVETPAGELRPETLVTVRIAVPLGEVLAVPRDAIVDTGTEQVVFVRHEAGRFEPRRVVVGRDAEGYREVVEGLAPGEEVVVSANFLIDSESRFRAAAAQFQGSSGAAASGADASAPAAGGAGAHIH
jgi:Cu(I)/Ag(I) efflux system membrane fusion protein